VRALDVVVIAVYCTAVVVFGLVLAGRQRDASDYFLGRRGLPWWAIMLSIVATETSALTVISVPGLAARGNLTFLQLSFGSPPRSSSPSSPPGVSPPASSRSASSR
jgi:Na+/proline symporter